MKYLLISLFLFSSNSFGGLCTCNFALSPHDYQSVDPPTFLWIAPSQPPPPMCYFLGYWVCINKGIHENIYSLDCNFLLFTFNNQNDSCFTLPNSEWSKLIIDTSYYWLTRTVGGPTQWCASNLGPIKRLYAALSPVKLLYPVNGVSGVSLTPLLDWEKNDTATGYRVRIYNTPSLNTVILDTLVNNDSMYVAEGKLISNQKYWWRVKSIKTGGEGPYSDVFCFTTGMTGVKAVDNHIPKIFSLYQNYPNPFNPTTKIKFSIPKGVVGKTFLTVYDVLGTEIATLVNEKLSPGTYEVEWDAGDYPSGVYFYQHTSGDISQTKKMVLLK